MLAVAKHLTMEWSEVLASLSLTILVKHLALPQLKQAQTSFTSEKFE